MANGLQRSSVSFRRQGSSGRVWDNLYPDRKMSKPISMSGPLMRTNTSGSGKGNNLYIKHIEKNRQELEERRSGLSKANIATTSRAAKPEQHKDQRCNVLACLRHCVGSKA
ncbi:hypothetical protein M5689_003067 [Euphorbia peplus]|nr:hypothetical protein M5689_003067 [Euphorbia peplus]